MKVANPVRSGFTGVPILIDIMLIVGLVVVVLIVLGVILDRRSDAKPISSRLGRLRARRAADAIEASAREDLDDG